jgi:putative tryptophan/tyrosine transport system substrate-binding protein
MRRREVIALVGGAVVAWPFSAMAQQAGRTYRVGSLHLSPRNSPHQVALFDELRRHGFVEGQNLVVDAHGYGLRIDQLAEHAAELVNAQVDVIICAGDAPVRAAQQATKTIPILGNATDMVGTGLVGSLAKPGGNTTGFSILAFELNGKRQDILMEALPGVRHMAALADGSTPSPQQLQILAEVARARGVELSINRVARPEEIATAIDAAKSYGAGAQRAIVSTSL